MRRDPQTWVTAPLDAGVAGPEVAPSGETALPSVRPWVIPVIVGVAVAGLLLIGWATTPTFVTLQNVQFIIRAAAIIGIVAVAMTFVTISGNFFSLSVGETASFTAIAFSWMVQQEWGVGVAIVLTLLLALLIGVTQGLIVAAGANPIITTLGAGAALFGLAAILTDNKTVRTLTHSAEWLGQGRPLGIPNQTWAFIALTVIAGIVLLKTPFGRRVTLVGANPSAATAAGIRRATVVVAVFAIAAAGASIAGIFTAAQLGQGVTDQFPELNINTIAAVLVGGAALAGGEGSMFRTALGALFIAALNNLMVIRGYSFGVRTMLVGAAVLVGVSLFNLLGRRAK